MNEITLMSFGYLYGLPQQADTVIGTRGLPNPYYVEELRDKTGLDQTIRDYVFSTPEAERYTAEQVASTISEASLTLRCMVMPGAAAEEAAAPGAAILTDAKATPTAITATSTQASIVLIRRIFAPPLLLYLYNAPAPH